MSFELNDKVYSLTRGWGTITGKDEVALYCLIVTFLENQSKSIYTLTGKRFDDDLAPELYHGEPEIIAPPEPERRPKFEMDAPIEVRTIGCDWVKRHFKMWNKIGSGVYCWDKGNTSFTATGRSFWPEWRIPK